MKRSKLAIFEYTDFRALAKARFAELKAESPKYSYAFISRLMGQDNSGWLKMAITGKRRLNESMALSLAKVLGFDKDEQAFFLDLVTFNQAQDDASRDQALRRMRRKQRFRTTHLLELNQVDYLENPLAMLIREMVSLRDFREDPAWIAQRLPEPMDARRITGAIRQLLDLELLTRDGNGKLMPKDAIQFVGHGLASHAMKRSYANQFAQATEALELPRSVRNFGFVTMTLSRKSFEAINDKLETLRNDIFEIVEQDDACDQVYQFVMGLFPLTRVDESWSDCDAPRTKNNAVKSREDDNEKKA